MRRVRKQPRRFFFEHRLGKFPANCQPQRTPPRCAQLSVHSANGDVRQRPAIDEMKVDLATPRDGTLSAPALAFAVVEDRENRRGPKCDG